MVLVRSFIPPALRVFALLTGVLAVPTSRSTGGPLVTLNYGTFQGFSSAKHTESFLGMPFAQPPVGPLRFNNPVPPQPFSGVRNATWFSNTCPQQILPSEFATLPPSVLQAFAEFLPGTLVSTASEDCLYLNVVRPAGVQAGADLPVVVFIYGGAFEVGDASGYNGTRIVSRSLSLKSPVVYVSFNYRLNAFGFLGGKEVKAAGLGNFGLHDQRFALQWVQKYIRQFGGNPERVILWGHSAGSISVMHQLVAYNGELDGLFQGAFMESGSVLPNHDITSPGAQANYDFLVERTNCSSAQDTLNCLRQAPYQSILNATLQTPTILSYQATNIAWAPMVDGVFLKESTRQAVREGNYAEIPVIFGNVDDEGTEFSLSSFNITTNNEFLEYVRTNFLVGITQDELQEVSMAYPDDPTLGSPYDVGTNDTVTPEYKRISSFQGDLIFSGPRRYSVGFLTQTQNVWCYLWKRDKSVPILGSFHGSDLQEFYDVTGNSDWVGADALVNFAYNLNPNVPHGGYPSGAASSLLSNISWPRYGNPSPVLLTFEDPNVLTLTSDTFRVDQFKLLDEIQRRLGW